MTTTECQPIVSTAIVRLQYLCDTIPLLLKAIPEQDFSNKPSPKKWSKKEILGHLIDSAANNHQRFVRGQFAPHTELPTYQQEQWVATQSYTTESWPDLVNLWLLYNRHLLHLLRHMPENAQSH